MFLIHLILSFKNIIFLFFRSWNCPTPFFHFFFFWFCTIYSIFLFNLLITLILWLLTDIYIRRLIFQFFQSDLPRCTGFRHISIHHFWLLLVSSTCTPLRSTTRSFSLIGNTSLPCWTVSFLLLLKLLLLLLLSLLLLYFLVFLWLSILEFLIVYTVW